MGPARLTRTCSCGGCANLKARVSDMARIREKGSPFFRFFSGAGADTVIRSRSRPSLARNVSPPYQSSTSRASFPLSLLALRCCSEVIRSASQLPSLSFSDYLTDRVCRVNRRINLEQYKWLLEAEGKVVPRVRSDDQPTRRSPRLKSLYVLREAKLDEIVDLSSDFQKCAKESDAIVTKQIKCEMLEPEDGGSSCISSDDASVPPDSASDEIGLIDITLKDLRERCKTKRKKLQQSVSPSKVGTGCKSSCYDSQTENHDHVKVKQEEPDLEEPLIVLKLKRSKRSNANNKRRKSSNVSSVPLISEDGVTTLPFGASNSEVSDDGTTVLDLKTTKGTHIPEVDNSVIPLATGEIPELFYHVKTEIVETSSLGYHIEDCNAISSTSSAILPLKEDQSSCSNTPALDNCDQISSLPVFKDLHVDCPNKNFEEPRSDTQMDRHMFHCADSSVCFTVKLCSPEDSPTVMFDRVNEDLLQNDHLDTMPRNSQLSHVTELSLEHRESENYAIIPQTGEVRKSEMDEVLSMPKHNSLFISSASAGNGGPLDSDDHKSIWASTSSNDIYTGSKKSQNIAPKEISKEQTVEEINCPAVGQSHELMKAETACTTDKANDGAEDLANGIPRDKMPICIQVKDATDEHNLLCKEVYGLEEIFLSGKESQCCGELVHDAVPGHSLCSLPIAKRCSNAVNEWNKTSTKREFFSKLEDVLNDQAQTTTNFSGEFSSLSNLDGPRELDIQSCTAAPLSSSASSCMQYADDNLLKDAEDLCCADKENFKSILNQPIKSITSYAVLPFNKQPECDEEFMEDHPPKKLLSNRKIISPTSQEKLCKALSDIDIHDVSQATAKRKRLSLENWTKTKTPSLVPDQKEADLFLEDEPMNKKARNHFNSQIAVKKVTFKSQETSARAINIHMEKAIEFTQRQMHDIERLSTKLLKGLDSMKSIVEEALTLQAHSSLPSKFSSEEIRAASEDASELEKTTRRWLSIMTKDCNRFCKIMRSADNKSSSLGNAARKERKITFADEVGGMLCHVKVFEQQPSSPMSLEGEQGGR